MMVVRGGGASTGTVKLGTVVGCYAVEDDEANVATLDLDWDLKGENVVLAFEVRGDGADDVIEGRFGDTVKVAEVGVASEDLGEPSGGERCLGADVEGGTA
jgi:hypothetical protein